MTPGTWQYSTAHRQPCQIVESQTLWDHSVCRVWLPRENRVVQLHASGLVPLEAAADGTAAGIVYAASAARVADALTHDVLLAPIESSVIPLPHQIQALSQAFAGDRLRYLLADEVGLGKTIEAGLILRELKLRGMVERTLVIAPKGLVTQWVAEMHTHFSENFRLVIPGDFAAYRRVSENENIWESYTQVVCPIDSVKPMDARRGWTHRQVTDYNRERFEDLVTAGWDLVIVDEAHRLAGSTDEVARFKLGQGLSKASPFFLLLSATPHQGKTDAFRRLMSLLDAEAFPDAGSVTRDRVQPYVIRTEKRRAITGDGSPLFKPRRTEIASVDWGADHGDQQALYEAVTEYVRQGYNQAIREKRSYIGFLMILMQRLVVSSTAAIRTTLERRLDALTNSKEQLSLFPMYADDEWAELDGQEQIDMLLTSQLKALKNERSEVRLLLTAAIECMESGVDAKAETLLDLLYRLQAEEGDPDLKYLVFTEFVPTQEMLRQFLTERGFAVVCLNGSMTMEERKRVQDSFSEEARILISTDAGGEGLNLQFCHVVLNYDIPWNPMRLEQRIGRVDRIGQTHVVRAINFVFEDSVEYRVREVLEHKLTVIREEFGIDKTGDVLDSAQAEQIFDNVFVDAILNPDDIDASVEKAVAHIKQQAQYAQKSSAVLSDSEDVRPSEAERILTHPLPHWVERMTVSYLNSHGGETETNGTAWHLTWPDGTHMPAVVFTSKEVGLSPSALHLTLEDPRVRALATKLPRFVPGQQISIVAIEGVSAQITGLWSLWRIAVTTLQETYHRIMPLFLSDEGPVYVPTARHIWDQLLGMDPAVHSHLDDVASAEAFERVASVAERHGRPVYGELVEEHRARMERQREKRGYAFNARRAMIEGIGLPEVRNHRLNLLREEERAWTQTLEEKSQVYPEMVPLLIIRVDERSNG